MYEARQNKEKVSRVISTGGGTRQHVKMRNIKESTVLQKYTYPSNDPDKYCSVETYPSNGKANKVIADMKGEEGDFDGGPPTTKVVGWDWLSDDARKNNWVKFHIWNQKLGGPGNDIGNLIPTTKQINNGGQWISYETDFKKIAKNGIFAEINVLGYYYYNNKETGFPTGITGYYKDKSNDETKQIKLSMEPPSMSDLIPIPLNIQQYLDEVSRIPANQKERIAAVKKEFGL